MTTAVRRALTDEEGAGRRTLQHAGAVCTLGGVHSSAVYFALGASTTPRCTSSAVSGVRVYATFFLYGFIRREIASLSYALDTF